MFGTVCGDWQCLPGQSPVLEQQGLQVHWHVVVGSAHRPACPVPGEAQQHRPIPEISCPRGLVPLIKT